MNIAITGGNSNLGNYLFNYLKKGNKVFLLGRRDCHTFYDLKKKFNYDFIKKNKIKILIHLAYEYSSNSRNINLHGSINLFKNIDTAKTRIIYMSSYSSHKSALSIYGKTKYSIEKIVPKKNSIIIRPGLIFGYKIDKKIILFRYIINCIPIIPYFINDKKFLYSVQIKELCSEINKFIKKKKIKKIIYNIHSKEKIFLKDLIDLMNFKKKIYLQIPYCLIYFPIIILSKIIYLKSIDSFLGLIGNKPNENCYNENIILTKKSILKEKLY
jgi:nucleoside-diphosphate-sugar epimerase